MAIIEFINRKNKTLIGLRKVLEYITQPSKTSDHLKGGKDCDIKRAYKEFCITKKSYNKTSGRQYIHFTQSFPPYDKATPEKLKQVANELLKLDIFKDFQIAYAVHTDREHLHTHFVINSVSAVTGKKWTISKTDLDRLKEQSDLICKKHELLITQGEKGSRKKTGEYRSVQNNRSWKQELFLAVDLVKNSARNKEEFISNLNKLGYTVDWSESRKYIMFTTPDGKKCRNIKLYPPEAFTKEALFKAFDRNKYVDENRYYGKGEMNEMDSVLLKIQRLFQPSSSGENVDNIDDHLSGYPLSVLDKEGNALKDKIAESKKGKGFDWKKDGLEF